MVKIFGQTVAAAAVALLFVGPAEAAFVAMVDTGDGVNFDVKLLADAPGEFGAGVFDIDVNIGLNDAPTGASATDTGNPFFQAAGLISTTQCIDGFTECGIYGGSNFGGTVAPTAPDEYMLGTLNIGSATVTEAVVGSTSRFTLADGGPQAASNTGETIFGGGDVPEPGAFVLLGMSLAGLAFIRRKSA
jgi:hypothetical protein